MEKALLTLTDTQFANLLNLADFYGFVPQAADWRRLDTSNIPWTFGLEWYIFGYCMLDRFDQVDASEIRTALLYALNDNLVDWLKPLNSEERDLVQKTARELVAGLLSSFIDVCQSGGVKWQSTSDGDFRIWHFFPSNDLGAGAAVH